MTRERTERRPAGQGPEHYLPGVIKAVNDLGTIVSQLHGEISTLNGVRQLGANPRAIVNGQSMRLSTSAGRLAGFSIRETSGVSTALVRIRDGGDATADPLALISLAAGESVRDWFLPGGISFGYGLFVDVAAGAVEAIIYLGPAVTT